MINGGAAHSRCSIAAMTDRDPKGFSTRAIRAASRTPAVNQRPTAVPIYQTATFTSTDAWAICRLLPPAMDAQWNRVW